MGTKLLKVLLSALKTKTRMTLLSGAALFFLGGNVWGADDLELLHDATVNVAATTSNTLVSDEGDPDDGKLTNITDTAGATAGTVATGDNIALGANTLTLSGVAVIDIGNIIGTGGITSTATGLDIASINITGILSVVSGDITVAGVSSTGNVWNATNSTLTFGSATTTGDIVGNAGTISFLSTGSVGAITTSNSGTISFVDAGTVGGNIVSTGTIHFGDTGYVSGSITNTGAGASVTFTEAGTVTGDLTNNDGLINFISTGSVGSITNNVGTIKFGNVGTVGGNVTSSGTISFANNAKINGNFTSNAANNTIDLSGAGTGSVVTITGTLTLSASTLKYDVSNLAKIVATAVDDDGTANVINISNANALAETSYILMTGTGITAGKYSITGIGGRTVKHLEDTGNALTLVIDALGAIYDLTWLGVSGAWDTSTAGQWKETNGGTAQLFATSDTVVFGSTGATKAVVVAAGGVIVGDMLVSDAGYVFTGGTIAGDTLTVEDAVTFSNAAIDFVATDVTGATLTMNTTNESDLGALTLDGGSLVNTKNAVITSVNSDGASTITNNNATALDLNVVTVDGGSLTLNGSGTFGATSVEVNTGATLVQSKALDITGNLTNAGTVTSTAALTVGTFDNLATGNMSVGAFTTGTGNSFNRGNLTITAGASFVNGGILNNSGMMNITAGILDTGIMNFSNGATLSSGAAIDVTGMITIALNGGYTQSGTAALHGSKAAITVAGITGLSGTTGEFTINRNGMAKGIYELVLETAAGTENTALYDALVAGRNNMLIGSADLGVGAGWLYTVEVTGPTKPEAVAIAVADCGNNAGAASAIYDALFGGAALNAAQQSYANALEASPHAITKANGANAAVAVNSMAASAANAANGAFSQVSGANHAARMALGGTPNGNTNYASSQSAGGKPVTFDEVVGLTGNANCFKNSGFLKAYGGWGQNATNSDSKGYSFGGAGVLVGLDRRISNELTLGALFGYSFNQATILEQLGEATDHVLRFGLYGQYNWNGFYFNTTPTMGIHMIESKRNENLNDVALGKRTGFDFSWLNEVGYTFKYNNFMLTPSYSLAMTYFRDPEYHESGAVVNNLNYDTYHSWSLTQNIGLKLGYSLEVGGMTLLPEVWMGWEHEYLTANDMAMNSPNLNNAAWTAPVSRINENRATFGAGLSTLISKKYEVFGRWDYKMWDGGFHSNFTVGLGVKF